MVMLRKAKGRRGVWVALAALLVLALAAVGYSSASGGKAQRPQAGAAAGAGPRFGTLSPKEALKARASVPVDKNVPKFGGVSITAMGDAGHNMNPFAFWAPEWKNARVNIRVIEVPFADVYSKEKAEFIAGTNAVDLVVFYPAYIGDFASNGYLRPLDSFMKKQSPHLNDTITAFRKLYLGWQGKTYALPYDGDVHIFIYRKDLLNNPAEQAAFKAKYGRKLTVPRTWDDYLRVGEFFTRKAGQKLGGKVLKRPFYGCAEYGQRGFSWAWFMDRFAALGGVYFDKNMVPQINSPAAVRALTNMRNAVKKCSPPDVLNYGYDQLRDALIQGTAFMVVQWTDVPKKGADPTQSKVVGKLGYATLPGYVVNGKFITRSMMPVGRVLAVTKNSRHPDAAYWVAKYLSDDKSLFQVSTPLDGLDPYRFSHLKPSAYKVFKSRTDAASYLATVKKVLTVGFPEIFIPGAAQYADALDLAVNKAISGQTNPKSALDQAAKAWNDITGKLDRKRQTQLWRAALKTYAELGLYKP
jgi:multiple sugar transport system substrate-binding protein